MMEMLTLCVSRHLYILMPAAIALHEPVKLLQHLFNFILLQTSAVQWIPQNISMQHLFYLIPHETRVLAFITTWEFQYVLHRRSPIAPFGLRMKLHNLSLKRQTYDQNLADLTKCYVIIMSLLVRNYYTCFL